jgi:uncharacterized protein YjeT (DUF2065 family)
MINLLASILVVLTGLYLIGLALVLLLSPARATRFLCGFASSAFAHYLELVLRLIAGGAILLSASRMLLPDLFVILGWVLVVTTAGLFAVPWRWHQRFARRAVPYATRNLRLVGAASFALGVFVLASVVLGGALLSTGSARLHQWVPPPSNNDLRPTPYHDASHQSRQQGAGDAGRWAAKSCNPSQPSNNL